MRSIPYSYIYDGSALTDGASYSRRQVPMREDGIFHLRRVAGVNNVATAIRLYHSTASNDPQSSYAARVGTTLMLAPEMTFRRPEGIIFDLNGVSRSVIACGLTPIYPSHIAFQGVRSLDEQPMARPKGFQRPYTWTYTLTVDWYHYSTGTNLAAPRYHQIKIDTYDFEWRRLRISNSDGTALTGNDFAVQFYDAERYELSNTPQLATFVNNASDPQTVWPTTPVVYPRNSIIRFAVQSFLCSAVVLPRTYQLAFEGSIWT